MKYRKIPQAMQEGAEKGIKSLLKQNTLNFLLYHRQIPSDQY